MLDPMNERAKWLACIMGKRSVNSVKGGVHTLAKLGKPTGLSFGSLSSLGVYCEGDICDSKGTTSREPVS